MSVMSNGHRTSHPEPTFIDLFAGAGCLSLGLMASGWRGILAVEKDPMAFKTLRHNLIDGDHCSRYDWPEWFPKQPCTAEQVANEYHQQFLELRGKVTMIVGGPPCQGFSLAGRRDKQDQRNSLFEAYIRIVRAIQPRYIVLENVQGISMMFDRKIGAKRVGTPAEPYSQRIIRAFQSAGYEVKAGVLKAADYGVPQLRPRYFLIGARREFAPLLHEHDPFTTINSLRCDFLQTKGLPTSRTISVKEAISDLETVGNVVESADSPRFLQGTYAQPITVYQKLMRAGLQDSLPDSHRLANHRPATIQRFEQILTTCRKGVALNQSDRERFGLKKHSTIPLDPCQPSRTLTTLPDDIIHYSEPRILTVREYARLQSIPDWFQFLGAYTTGGERRTRQCPRYTQAGNAVPPFVGEIVGIFLRQIHELAERSQFSSCLSRLNSTSLGIVAAGDY